jgi:pimeloyl-ACP methyl ester carboxylesterase
MRVPFVPVLAAALLTIAVLLQGAQAEEVRTRLRGTTLNGELSVAKGKQMEDGVVLLVHGTLAHNKMELIGVLQRQLAARGLSSLAVNLSLGVNDRHGFFDCGRLHTHRYTDAVEEIAAWVGWLKNQGVLDISILGHSLGGAQVAAFAAGNDDPSITNIVLLAPATFDAARVEAAYQARYGVDLAELRARAQKQVVTGGDGAWMPGIGFLTCENATVTAGSFLSYYMPNTARDTPTLLKRMNTRTLVVVAGADALVPELAPAMAALDGTRDISIKTIDGADHFFLDLFGEDAADAIASFLTR